MDVVKPRFEFRAFAQGFGPILERMRRLSPIGEIRESREIYIVSKGNNANNTKIRDDKMDIKVFVAEEAGLQQWNPRMKGRFPMAASMLRDEVFPAFGVAPPAWAREVYTLQEFLREVIAPHPDLVAVDVFKRRFGMEIGGVTAEWASLLINGAAIQTLCLESTDVPAILAARHAIAANALENVNYLLAIKRIIGMEPLPEDFVPVLA